jgi:hypothetical protein
MVDAGESRETGVEHRVGRDKQRRCQPILAAR